MEPLTTASMVANLMMASHNMDKAIRERIGMRPPQRPAFHSPFFVRLREFVQSASRIGDGRDYGTTLFGDPRPTPIRDIVRRHSRADFGV